MESKKTTPSIIEKFKKNTKNPDKVIEDLDHWFDCKNEIDDGASGEEHKIYKAVRDLIKGVFQKDE
ncbi:MAG: hypothetical protein R2828_35650 [Saprospiraceae bacterium]